MSAVTFHEAASRRAQVVLSQPRLMREDALIDGESVRSERTIQVRNPATTELLATVPNLPKSDVERAVTVAAAALPEWRSRSTKSRSMVLRRWFDLVVANAEDLARLLTCEQGKPLAEARGEIAYAASYIEWFAEEAKRVYGDTIPSPDAQRRLVVLKQPVGVVAAITPWNFPAAMVTRKVAPALAAGCTVVLKPSELTPLSALALAWLAVEAGVPPGVVNVVTGEPQVVGDVLTSAPEVRKLTFTGSTRVGKMLAARCMDTVKRVTLELGGNAPFIVFGDADIKRAVAGAILSKFRNTGQTCVCANRLLVHSSVHDEFVAELAARTCGMVVGHGLDGPTDQGPLINLAALERTREHIDDAISHGAQLVDGGTTLPGPGYFHRPTVLTGITPMMRLFREETFGPVAGIARFDDERSAITLANNSSAGLAAYVYTRDVNRYWRVSEALEYGMVGLNTGLISTEVAPFGGIKESGFGREGSHYGLDDYVDIKLLCTEVEPM